jgi:hypothetical protein
MMPDEEVLYIASKVLPFPGTTEGAIFVDKVCDAAKAVCSEVLILGIRVDDSADTELYMAASIGDKMQLLYWVEDFKMRLMRGDFDGDA